MNVLARSLVVAAIVGYIGGALPAADARPGGASAAAAGQGANGVGVAGTAGGHGGSNGQNGDGGHGAPAPSPAPAPSHGGEPPVSNPPDFNSQSGFTALAASSGACGAPPPQLPDTSWYNDPVDGIEVISQQTQNYLQFCGCATQACVADALDNYADALEKAVAPAPPIPGGPPVQARKVPRAVRELPKVVHEAAARVRAAPTKVAAQKAVQAAIEIVQKTAAKTIALMRADDPDAKKAATRGSDLVADTLKSAGASLLRADTL